MVYSKNVNIKMYTTIILPAVLYRCEIRSPLLREEYILNIVKNRVLRTRSEPKGDEIIGDWRNLHDTELHNLYSLPDIISMIKSSRMRWAGHVAEEECLQDFGGKAGTAETTRKTQM
jgi:hypothetical protein